MQHNQSVHTAWRHWRQQTVNLHYIQLIFTLPRCHQRWCSLHHDRMRMILFFCVTIMMQHNQSVHTAWRHCSGSTKVDQIKKHKQALFSQPDVLCHLTHEKKYKRPKIKNVCGLHLHKCAETNSPNPSIPSTILRAKFVNVHHFVSMHISIKPSKVFMLQSKLGFVFMTAYPVSHIMFDISSLSLLRVYFWFDTSRKPAVLQPLS